MMKRIFILLAVLLISTLSLAAEIKTLSSDSFEIKGYKITGSDDVEFVITDAISESLNTFQQSNTSGGDVSVPVGEIDATSHMGTFLSDTADISADNVDNIIFSYRLVASNDAKYTITFNITPFTSEDGNYDIDAAFKTDHQNLVYSDGTQADFPYKPDKETASVVTTDKEFVVLEGSITPTSGNSRQWIFRGAVLMAVSRGDYDDAPRGRYTSRVTATLTIN